MRLTAAMMRSVALLAGALALPLAAQRLPTTPDERKLVDELGKLLPRDVISAQLEPSYITFGGTPFNHRKLGNLRPNLLFEGNIAPHFSLRTDIANRWALVFTSKVVVRMINDEDHPVRTPSYLPQLTFYYVAVPLADTGAVPDKRRTSNLWSRSVIVWLRASHFSNGQEDPEFNPDGTLNIRSGGFNSNFMEAGVSLLNVFHHLRAIRVPLWMSAYYGASLRIHPRHEDLSDPVLWRGYGDRRFRGHFTGVIRKSSPDAQPYLRVLVDLEAWRLRSDGITMSGAIALRPPFADDFWLFGRLYRGQDYYNIHWRDGRLKTAQIGMMAITSASLWSAR